MNDTRDGSGDGAAARAFSALLLSLSGELVAGIQAGGAARGFGDVRPAHGYAFARLAPHGATIGELADHLGFTKQAASQLVDELVRKGYVERRPHPGDARARLVVLTDRGWACTRAADEAAAETVAPWIAELGAERFHALVADLARLAPRGPIRPSW
ncbi:MarR family winged helix-turn-helix transcriptional regulator [Streptacidiphilus sp. EB103A]|uniref:MarR family winged helix-turn-helix transcriptional regulator n=1 Tax=Streptacidiphilus sp. EB103A TaxID=3156275 RepID=UPI003514D1D7